MSFVVFVVFGVVVRDELEVVVFDGFDYRYICEEGLLESDFLCVFG